jgi:opacity protein-like surface antigen
MKINRGSLVLLLLLSTNLKATAHGLIFTEKIYIKAGLGGFQCDKFKETEGGHIKKKLGISPVLSLGVGYRFTDYIRSDIDIQYNKLTYKASNHGMQLNQKIKVVSGMINLYGDLYTGSFATPYIVVGVGLSKNSVGALTMMQVSPIISRKVKGKSKTNLAWNVGGGVVLDTMSADYLIDICYRYMDFGKILTGPSIVDVDLVQRIKGHQCIISVLFKL